MAVQVITSLLSATKGEQLSKQGGKGNLNATGKLLRQLLAQDRALTTVKIGSMSGSTSSISVTIQSGFTPTAVVVFTALGSAVYIGHGAIGDGKAMYIRGNASIPQSMGIIASQGIYLQSNGFSIGSQITNAALQSYGYMAFKSAPGQE